MEIKKNKGQVAVEYVLLLVIVVALGVAFKGFIEVKNESNPDDSAPFIQYWRGLIKKIGEDTPHP